MKLATGVMVMLMAVIAIHSGIICSGMTVSNYYSGYNDQEIIDPYHAKIANGNSGWVYESSSQREFFSFAITRMANGKYVVAGELYTYEGRSMERYGYFEVLNSDGSLFYNRTLHELGEMRLISIHGLDNGSLIITWYKDNHARLVTLDGDYNVVYNRIIGEREQNFFPDIIPDNNTSEGYAIYGSVSEGGNTTLVKIGSHGEITWEKSFNRTSDISSVSVMRVMPDANGSTKVLLIRKKDMTRYDNDYWLVKLDDGANTAWKKKIYSASLYSELFSLCKAGDGGFIACGTLDGNVLAVKTDSNGNVEWNRTYCSGIVFNTAIDVEGCMAGVGMRYSEELNDHDILLLKIGSDGELLWDKAVGVDSKREQAYDMVMDGEGGIVYTGNRDDLYKDILHSFTAKYSGLPDSTAPGIELLYPANNTELELEQELVIKVTDNESAIKGVAYYWDRVSKWIKLPPAGPWVINQPYEQYLGWPGDHWLTVYTVNTDGKECTVKYRFILPEIETTTTSASVSVTEIPEDYMGYDSWLSIGLPLITVIIVILVKKRGNYRKE